MRIDAATIWVSDRSCFSTRVQDLPVVLAALCGMAGVKAVDVATVCIETTQ